MPRASKRAAQAKSQQLTGNSSFAPVIGNDGSTDEGSEWEQYEEDDDDNDDWHESSQRMYSMFRLHTVTADHHCQV
jgi:hypothetical protein